MADLFADVKVGDVFFTHGARQLYRYKVTHLTPTRFKAGEAEFRKSDGRRVGGGPNAHPATADMVDRFKAEQNEIKARKALIFAAVILTKARGGEAIRLAALLPPELKGE